MANMDNHLVVFEVKGDISDNPRVLDAEDLGVQIFISHQDILPDSSLPAHTETGRA